MRNRSRRDTSTPLLARRAGFSLLEAVLALAILGGAIAVLGEAARLALRNAEFARDMARAQLLCEGKLAEVVTGLIPAEATHGVVAESTPRPNEPNWLYTIETTSVEEGLLSVRVTVTRDLPAAQRPVRFSLVRWIPDPNASPSAQGDEAPQTGNSTDASGSGGAR